MEALEKLQLLAVRRSSIRGASPRYSPVFIPDDWDTDGQDLRHPWSVKVDKDVQQSSSSIHISLPSPTRGRANEMKVKPTSDYRRSQRGKWEAELSKWLGPDGLEILGKLSLISDGIVENLVVLPVTARSVLANWRLRGLRQNSCQPAGRDRGAIFVSLSLPKQKARRSHASDGETFVNHRSAQAQCDRSLHAALVLPGGRGVKSLEGLGPVPHWAPRAYFFSQRRTFDLIKKNQTNQTCGKCWSFTGSR